MKENKEPFGTSIDPIKEKILIPSTADLIKETLLRRDDLTIFDYGSGDSSSILYLKDLLEKDGFQTKQLILCDSNQSCLGPSHLNIFDNQNKLRQDYSVVEIENYSDDWTRLNILENRSVDVIVAQNSLHQIGDDIELQSFIARSVRFMKGDGVFVFTDLSPKYLDWLRIKYPEKLSDIVEDNGRILRFEYNSSSGGSAMVYNRSLEEIASKFLLMGLYPVKGRELGIDELSGQKERYAEMVEDGIPMFTTILFKLDPKIFISYDEGCVKRIVQGKNLFDIYFRGGGDKISIPIYPECKKIKEGDEIILVQTLQDEGNGKVPTLTIIVSPKGKREGSFIQYLRQKK